MAWRLNDVVAKLAAEDLAHFEVGDVVRLLGVTPGHAQQIAHRLAAANLARRVRRGQYVLLPPEDWAERDGFAVNWYLTAAQLAAPHDYYLAYYTAMELHGMLQHPLGTVFIATTVRRQTVETGPVRFRFVTLRPARFFGAEDRQVEPGRPVRLATLERTYLDGADRLNLCGGIEEVFRGYARRLHDLNADRLLRFVHQLDRPAVTKRLGYLLELAGYPDREVIWELERAAGRIGHYVALDNTRPVEKGPRDRRWELALNADPHALLKAIRT